MQDKFEQHRDARERAELHQEYDRTLAQIKSAYDKAIAPALKQYRISIEKAKQRYQAIKQTATSKEEVKAAFEHYDEFRKTLWSDYREITDHENRIQITKVKEASIKFNEEIKKIDQQFFG